MKEVKRLKQKIVLKISVGNGGKFKKSVFQAVNEEEAKAIETALSPL